MLNYESADGSGVDPIIRIKMHDQEKKLAFSRKIVTENSIRNTFLLPKDARVVLSYKANNGEVTCESLIVPEPCFSLPNEWSKVLFIVKSDKVPLRPSSPVEVDRSLTPMEVEKANRVLRITNFWEGRVFRLIGDKLAGSCVLINDRHILSTAHLSFKLHESYRVTGAEGRNYKVKCKYICKVRDFALFQSDDLPVMDLPVDSLGRGMKFFAMGYPCGIDASSPTSTKGIIEGFMDDYIHLVGSPGSRRGYSGAPVFSESGKVGGILLGGTAGLSIDTTFRECLASSDEQRYTRILPIGIIIDRYKQGNSDTES